MVTNKAIFFDRDGVLIEAQQSKNFQNQQKHCLMLKFVKE